MTGIAATCFVGYVLGVRLSLQPTSAEPICVKHSHRWNDMQAMNGTRSTELSGSDVLLDSGGSDPAQQQHLLRGADDFTPEASEHATAPDTLPTQPALQQADDQAAYAQQSSARPQGVVHPESGSSWQQPEGSVQEVASTSASSESGNTPCTHIIADQQ